MKKAFISWYLVTGLAPSMCMAHDVSSFNEAVHMTVIILCIAPFVYFLPAILAASVGHPQSSAIFLINLFLGWSVVGWICALAWVVLPFRRKAIGDDGVLSPTPIVHGYAGRKRD